MWLLSDIIDGCDVISHFDTFYDWSQFKGEREDEKNALSHEREKMKKKKRMWKVIELEVESCGNMVAAIHKLQCFPHKYLDSC